MGGSNGMNQIQIARAFQIADEAMIDLLVCHTHRLDEYGKLLGLLSETGREVSSLAEAEQAVIEAVEWLQERGLCMLMDDPAGVVIMTTEDGL